MRGFSLVEMLLSIAIMAIIAALSAPVFFSFQSGNEFGLAADTSVRTLRRAQFLAQNMDQDSNWGVNFATSSITLYSGANYAGRDTDFDERYDLASNVTSTPADINFTKFSGLPVAPVDIILRSNSGDIKTISVNAVGAVDF